jgi:hypothetical protein
MPPNPSGSIEAFRSNMGELIAAGHPKDQAYAIAKQALNKACGRTRSNSIAFEFAKQTVALMGEWRTSKSGNKYWWHEYKPKEGKKESATKKGNKKGSSQSLPTSADVEQWKQRIGARKADAVEEWRMGDFQAMRAIERGASDEEAQKWSQRPIEDVKKDLQAFKDAVEEAPVYKGDLYRGLGELTLAQIETFKNDAIIDQKVLSSWAPTRAEVEGFASGNSVVLHLTSTSGAAKVINIAQDVKTDLSEVIMPATKFRIVDSYAEQVEGEMRVNAWVEEVE